MYSWTLASFPSHFHIMVFCCPLACKIQHLFKLYVNIESIWARTSAVEVVRIMYRSWQCPCTLKSLKRDVWLTPIWLTGMYESFTLQSFADRGSKLEGTLKSADQNSAVHAPYCSCLHIWRKREDLTVMWNGPMNELSMLSIGKVKGEASKVNWDPNMNLGRSWTSCYLNEIIWGQKSEFLIWRSTQL